MPLLGRSCLFFDPRLLKNPVVRSLQDLDDLERLDTLNTRDLAELCGSEAEPGVQRWKARHHEDVERAHGETQETHLFHLRERAPDRLKAPGLDVQPDERFDG